MPVSEWPMVPERYSTRRTFEWGGRRLRFRGCHMKSNGFELYECFPLTVSRQDPRDYWVAHCFVPELSAAHLDGAQKALLMVEYSLSKDAAQEILSRVDPERVT